MFSKSWTTKSTENFSDSIIRLKNEIDTADAILIGAGAGLSVSAGFDYAGERFERYFSDFHKNTVSPICIRAVSTLLKHSKNIGRGGQGTFL